MRKLAYFLIVLSLLLSACAAPAAPTTAPEAPKPAEPTKPPEAPKAAEPTKPPEATKAPEAQPAEETITLEYWQVDFPKWDQAILKVIEMFEAENPNIKVNYTPISYDEINEKIAAQVPTGQGPDLVNPFYGWVPLWKKSGFLAPLPKDMFPEAEIREQYLAGIEPMFIDGELWGLPMNLANWAILYNKDHFAEVGITELPKTWEEIRQAAIKCTKRSADGTLERAGFYLDYGTQEHILWKVLIEKNGQPMFSPDGKKVTWNDSPVGAETYTWFNNLWLTDKVMDVGWGEGPGPGFYTGVACMRLGSPGNVPVIKENAPDLKWGAFPLPPGTASDPKLANRNQSQYWSMNVTSKGVQDPKRAEAAFKFMKFLTKPEVIKAYIEIVGGLPPLKVLMDDPMFTGNPDIQAWLATLPDSVPIPWVDEKGERQVSLDMGDKVLLNGEDSAEVLTWGTDETQKLRDEFYGQ
jgi:multiple sugar transport system substrate-binding protein